MTSAVVCGQSEEIESIEERWGRVLIVVLYLWVLYLWEWLIAVPVLVLSNLVDAADALGCEAIGF